MKGSLYANPTFVRRNIKQPTVISIRPLVAYDDSRLYFNSLSMKWQAKDIVNCTYSSQYRVLLVLTDDFKIYVFTTDLQLITQLNNWEPKYIVGFELIEHLNLMLLIGTEEIELMRVRVVSNVIRTKFLSSMKFSIKRESHLCVEPQHKLKWNKGYGYVLSQDLLYVWSLQDVHFYSLSKLALRSRVTNIAKKEVSITTVYFSNYYKYTVIGLLNGDVRVWRLPINTLYGQKEILIHNFSHHSKEVEQIIQGESEKIIVTYGVDLIVNFLSIDTFELLRTFSFVGEYTKLYLYDHLLAYAIKDTYLGELNFGKNIDFITDLTGPPIHYDYSVQETQGGKQTKLQLTLASNLGIEVNASEVRQAKELNKIELPHIYPPLKSKSITQIISSPFETSTYYILVEDGDVFMARLEGSMGKIEEHYVVSKMYDSEKHVLHQTANHIAFLHIVPPEIDTEIIQKTVDKSFASSWQAREQAYSRLRLMAIGCSRGSIIFVSTLDMSTIYARVSYHREGVVDFKEVVNKETRQDWLVSVCEEKYMKIVNFPKNKANCLYTIDCGDVCSQIYGFEENLVIVGQRGLFDVAKFGSYEQEPTVILNRESINHQEDIIVMSYRCDLRVMLSGAKDNRIKIWTTSKILLYEIILDHSLKYCLWGEGMSVILVQNHKLCCLRDIPLQFKPNEIENYNKQFQLNYSYEDELPLSKYFQEILAKTKDKAYKIRRVKNHQSLHGSPNVTKHPEESKRMATSPHNKEGKELNRSALLNFNTPTNRRRATTTKTEEALQERVRQENDHEAIRKHLQELSHLKKITNESMLPKIKPKYEDIFVEFMREKLLNKKLLTRRDITLNRIIMKNLVKDHLGKESEVIKSFKLE